jgi:hypothetical protein
MEDIMQKPILFMLLLTIGLAAGVADPQNHAAIPSIKVATIEQMYQQDISNQGMDYPVVLRQYANQNLQAAMQLEQDYFDREQMSCHIGHDVLWDSQDPDYQQQLQFSMTEQGLVKVSLAQGSSVYYDLSCDDTDTACQVADVILDNGTSLKGYLIETCR